ncbi:MAG: cellulase family glycosylhydrolase [Stenotrophobium sp.]
MTSASNHPCVQPAGQPKTRRALAVTGMAALGLLCGCVQSSTPSASGNGNVIAASSATLNFLHVSAAPGAAGLHQIVDANGRSVLLRGVNLNGIRDDYVDSKTPLQTPYPIDPVAYANGNCPARGTGVPTIPICGIDAAQLRAFGYSAVRLPVSWSLLEPQPGQIDQTYIDRIAQIVAWFKQAGIYTVIDLHQDAWSKYVYTAPGQSCPPPLNPVTGAHEADGAPQWASSYLTPACMVDGIRELDTAVEEDFTKFWLDVPASDNVGLQEHFAQVVLALAKRFHNEPAVAGYELFNEPLPGLMVVPELVDATATFPFYAKVISTVLAGVPGFSQLFFIEPDALRNITDLRSEFLPWSTYSSYPNVVYAPHVYTHVFTLDAELASLLPSAVLAPLFPLSNGYSNAVGDAQALGLPLWVGEFGNGVSDDDTILRGHYQYADQYAIGNSLWLWKQDATDAKNSDGFSVLHGPFPPGAAFPSRIKFTARAYPVYTAGSMQSFSYDPDTASFDLKATSAAVTPGDRAHATLVFLPAAATAALQVEGAQYEMLDRGDGSHDLYIYPDGGDYHVHAGD